MNDPVVAPRGAAQAPTAQLVTDSAEGEHNGEHNGSGDAGHARAATERAPLDPAPLDAARLDAAPLVAAAQADAAALRAGPCPPQFIAELDAGFERASRAALADPALAERSLRLRRIARRIVPESMRPTARQLAAHADTAARRWPILLDLGRELAALADGMASEAAALEAPARDLLRRTDAAARRNPAVHRSLRNLARLIESSASRGDLPPPVRRAAGLADAVARRLRAQMQ